MSVSSSTYCMGTVGSALPGTAALLSPGEESEPDMKSCYECRCSQKYQLPPSGGGEESCWGC